MARIALTEVLLFLGAVRRVRRSICASDEGSIPCWPGWSTTAFAICTLIAVVLVAGSLYVIEWEGRGPTKGRYVPPHLEGRRAHPGAHRMNPLMVRHPGLPLVFDALDRDGEEVRIVGGAVRDWLIGRGVRADIDLATTALPGEVVRRVEAAGLKAVPTGIEHGTVTVIAAGRAVRGDEPARGCRDRRAPRQGGVRPRLGEGRGAARLHHERALYAPRRRGGGPRRRPSGCRGRPCALHRRCRPAHPRGLSAHPPAVPFPRRLWARPAGSRRRWRQRCATGTALATCRASGCGPS